MQIGIILRNKVTLMTHEPVKGQWFAQPSAESPVESVETVEHVSCLI
jgi:hypothetical protein